MESKYIHLFTLEETNVEDEIENIENMIESYKDELKYNKWYKRTLKKLKNDYDFRLENVITDTKDIKELDEDFKTTLELYLRDEYKNGSEYK